MTSENKGRALKAGWHGLIASLALVESISCNRTTTAGKLRWLFLWGVFGWHVGCTILDLEKEKPKCG